MVQFVGGPGGHPLLVVHRLADLDGLVEIGRQFEPGLLDQIAARRAEDHRPGLDAIGIGVALGVAHRGLYAGDKIGCIPIAWGGVGVGGELVEVADPAGADPAVLVDEGDVDHVVGAAAGRQLQIHPLVVDREGLDIESDLDAGLVLEFRKVLLQVFVKR